LITLGALQVHPDKNRGNVYANRAFQFVNNAYDALKADPLLGSGMAHVLSMFAVPSSVGVALSGMYGGSDGVLGETGINTCTVPTYEELYEQFFNAPQSQYTTGYAEPQYNASYADDGSTSQPQYDTGYEEPYVYYYYDAAAHDTEAQFTMPAGDPAYSSHPAAHPEGCTAFHFSPADFDAFCRGHGV
jgi:curved DNA-binding protein CbpA